MESLAQLQGRESLYICPERGKLYQRELEPPRPAFSHGVLKAEEITARQNVQRISCLATHMSGEVRTMGVCAENKMVVDLQARLLQLLKLDGAFKHTNA